MLFRSGDKDQDAFTCAYNEGLYLGSLTSTDDTIYARPDTFIDRQEITAHLLNALAVLSDYYDGSYEVTTESEGVIRADSS